MNIKIHSIHFDANRRLLDFIKVKVKKLIQFYDEIIGVEVFLRLENSQDLQNKIAEIKLEIPGNKLFAKKQSKSFEESINNCVNALRRQITRHKEKFKRA